MKEFNKLVIKNLNKSFGELKVLKDFNLTLENREFVTFLGPSGCGKSTALNCICGLIPITDGKIYIDDKCIDDSRSVCIPSEKRGFGMVFQNYALFPHLTVFKNIAFGLEIKKFTKKQIKDTVGETLSIVHLEGCGGKFPSQLSGGQQQRVAIARCIVMEPSLLLLDEPLSNLDAKLRVEMRYELKALHERLQISTIYVTHDQHEALALSDKIVVMKSGVIQQIGTPEDVYERPANLFVADFMGFKNLWKAKIEKLSEAGDMIEMIINVNGTLITVNRLFSEESASQKLKLKDAYENGQDVFTAIRPENIIVTDNKINSFDCHVDSIEYLGQLSQLTGSFGKGITIDVRTDRKVDIGSNTKLYIPPEKIYVYPKEEG